MALATQVVLLCTLSSTQCHRFTLTIAQRADVSPVLALVATDKVEFAVRPPHDATTRQRVALVLIIIIIIIIIIIMVWLRHGGGLRLPCGRGRAARGQIGMHSSCAMCWGCAASQSPCPADAADSSGCSPRTDNSIPACAGQITERHEFPSFGVNRAQVRLPSMLT